MHFYDVGCIDFFNGSVPLELFLKNCSNENEMSSRYGYRDIDEIKKWVMRTIMRMMFVFRCLDIEDSYPSLFIIGIPYCHDFDLTLGLIWKQSDNGLTFFASPFEIPQLKQKESLKELSREVNESSIKKSIDSLLEIIENYFGEKCEP
jgi:hypothetical protein